MGRVRERGRPREEIMDLDRRGSVHLGVRLLVQRPKQGAHRVGVTLLFQALSYSPPLPHHDRHPSRSPTEGPSVSARLEPETHYSSSEFILDEILNILLYESDLVVFKNRLTPTGNPNYISLEKQCV